MTERPLLRITIERHIDASSTDDFLGFYHDGFADLLTTSAVEQTVTDEEFRGYASNPDMIKFVGRDGDRPVALALVTTNLDLVKWINQAYYEHLYPEHFHRSAIYYFLTLVVAPDHQDGQFIHAMIEALALYIGLDKGVIAFDVCQHNIDTFAVPEMIEVLGKVHVDAECREIDAQRYFAYQITGIKALDLRDRKDHDVVIDLADDHRLIQTTAHSPEGAT